MFEELLHVGEQIRIGDRPVLALLTWQVTARLPDGHPEPIGRLVRWALEGRADDVLADLRTEGFVRPSVVGRLRSGPTLVLGHDKLVGRQGLVIEQVSTHGGQVRIDGEVWSARPYDDDLVIEPGAKVDIFAIKGATALVHRVPELDP